MGPGGGGKSPRRGQHQQVAPVSWARGFSPDPPRPKTGEKQVFNLGLAKVPVLGGTEREGKERRVAGRTEKGPSQDSERIFLKAGPRGK